MLHQPILPVLFVGAGPDAADHLTLGALKAITLADLFILFGLAPRQATAQLSTLKEARA